ncbi:hypothetical protein CEUSTIGMA_g14059.t1, partial [Chlamydomonas eustigma]
MDSDSVLSKRHLLQWVSDKLSISVYCLEQCSSGAIYCQILDSYFSGTVLMQKVNYHAREEYDIWSNYKVLQAAFVLLDVTKHIDVSKLSKGHSGENLELLQFLFKFLKKQKPLERYDAKQRRSLCRGGSVDVLPIPSCLASNFDFRTGMSPAGSPASFGSVSQGGGGGGASKSRVWSSRGLARGPIDVSHVVSKFKNGLAPPSSARPGSQAWRYRGTPSSTVHASASDGEEAEDVNIQDVLSVHSPRRNIESGLEDMDLIDTAESSMQNHVETQTENKKSMRRIDAGLPSPSGG